MHIELIVSGSSVHTPRGLHPPLYTSRVGVVFTCHVGFISLSRSDLPTYLNRTRFQMGATSMSKL